MFQPQPKEDTESSSAAVTTCVAGARPSSGYTTVAALGDLAFTLPVAMLPSPTDNNRFYVVEKKGIIRRVTRNPDTGSATSAVFTDISARVNSTPNEAGLLGVALHPKFADNGLLYFSYTKPSTTSPANLRSVIARGKSTDGGLTVNPNTLVEMLQFDQPFSNHNGGHLSFGPDGFLYASFGDGGSGGDPQGNGQKKDVLFGKILRLDVDQTVGTQQYGIPSDNPFANGGGKKEIFAYGLRNTWRFSFDKLTGELWAGDVGQNKYEEIDKVTLGGNYGWNTREGMHCYGTATNCPVPGAIDPVVEYDHTQGFSVTGGFVYRGTAIPELQGQYIFGDFGSGKIWSIPTAQSPTPPTMKVLVSSSLSIASFAQDNQGEIYVLDYGSGKIKKIVQTQSSDGIAAKLSETGCFEAADPRNPSSALIPYEVNSPLWSDGAEKARWMSLPPGGKIKILQDGDFDLPKGTILVKEFRIGGKRIETRLFMRHTDGSWAGYSYEWNDAETDAVLLPDGKTKMVGGTVVTPEAGAGAPSSDAGDAGDAGTAPAPVVEGGQEWTYPSRAQCMGCHNGASGSSLGLEIGQLNRDIATADGGTENQLTKLNAMGAFDSTTPLPATLTALPDFKSTDPAVTAEQKARSYLHSNCGFCHRPQGPGRGPADFRFSRTFAGTKVCNRAPESGDLGIADAKLFTPGDPTKSIISVRMHATGMNRMPPIGSAMVDDIGTEIIDAWITSVSACY